MINKAGNFDDILDNVRAILVCLFRKTKIDWVKYILRTIARPNLHSLSYAAPIANLIYLKNIPTGNWPLTSPDVNPINMGVVNKMLVAGTPETLREILFNDPPPEDLVYTERVIHLFQKAKAELLEFGRNTDHIPDYKISTKRKTRKPPSSTITPPPPPPSQSIPSQDPSSPPPPRTSREDRILDAIAHMSLQQEKFALQQEKFATYVHDGMSQLHDDHILLAQKLDEHFRYNEAVYSLGTLPPRPFEGLASPWPPVSYYAAFPSTTRAQDIPGSSGAGPSGAGDTTGAADPGSDVAGTSTGAGPTTGASDDTPME